ncbi:uncharacterized protein LOC130996641 [Salvia miltiorrhiza]|uniref:uncharacterized protein LOC130993437 n=1 Tax=Salvia miltiorrhiza TaxID=226208 RepID=UPI0025ACF64F|nr:uncharacterized protein LOC130993437 [Salvia miltiorrhiza]XP_057777920.1 uncharacterized protein LOC130996641 [Salvia miltiorrhiza]
MSSGMQDSSGRINKTNTTRRAWSSREEEVLLAALKELVAEGWKSDNGFRAGYLKKLEESIKKIIPTTDLKGMPHINSKITTWKKDYNSLTNMLKITGVGFNVQGTHMIDATDEQWDHIRKVDGNAKNMQFKSFKYFDQWSEIFGKDRATRDVAEDLTEAARQMYHNINLTQPQDVDGDYHVTLDDVNEDVPLADSVSQTQQAESDVRPPKKLRKKGGGGDKMLEYMAEISRDTKISLDTIAGRMGHDQDISKARKEVYAQLNSISGLSQTEKFEITNMLAKEVELLDVFTSLPEDANKEYVYHLLEEKKKKYNGGSNLE